MKMKTPRLYAPTTKADVLNRSLTRLGYCAVPYLVFALLWSLLKDDRLLLSFWFWWCVALIPALGLTLDLWRLQHTRHRASTDA